MSREILPPLPLFYEGDSYIIYLKRVGTKCVRILQLHRFSGNDSRNGVEEKYNDLPLEAKREVILQVRRRHIGKTVLT
jgi:hypothetical protein